MKTFICTLDLVLWLTCSKVKAAEDILSLTRSLKEMWLFGQLDTIGESKAEAETDKHARSVAERLRRIIEKEGAMSLAI